MVKIQLPNSVQFIIHTMEQAGFEAYAVGGCVRDSILGRTPDDWDITTSAKPEEVKRLFKHTADTGIQHGTVTVLLKGECYEVTTYRVDGAYEDGRHPKEVNFTSLLSEDLRRRDFTINAMAYNEAEGLIDLFGGQEDLKEGIIRCVGDPMERFSEDALRIMRAVRFSAQLGYKIEEKTTEAIRKLAHTLERISIERIQVELVKLLVSDHPEYVLYLYELGMTKVFLPEFDVMMETPQNNPHHLYSVGMHTIRAMQLVPKEKIQRLTMLLHDVGKPATRTTDERGIDHFHGHPNVGSEMARGILKRLRFDNETITRVCTLVHYHDYGNAVSATPAFTRKLINLVRMKNFPYLLNVKYADIMAQSEYCRESKLEKVAILKESYDEVLEQGMCISLEYLAVSGKDLIQAGMQPGKELGHVLDQLLDIVIEDPAMNDKKLLLDLVKRWGYI